MPDSCENLAKKIVSQAQWSDQKILLLLGEYAISFAQCCNGAPDGTSASSRPTFIQAVIANMMPTVSPTIDIIIEKIKVLANLGRENPGSDDYAPSLVPV
jgi:hypothetical protein